jgi:alpha-1,2-mannosyltransferase
VGRLLVLLLVVVAGVLGALFGEVKDLAVYRHDWDLLLAGDSPYSVREPVFDLPFTYPPLAAIGFAPLALLPMTLVKGLWTAGSVAALAGTVALVLRASGRRWSWWLVALLVVGSLALEPVWQTLWFGQVNLLLVLALLADLLRPHRRCSGVLVGVVAGLKLTPLLFLVVLLAVGRRRMAWRAAAAFAGTVVVGLLVPGGAAYWSDGLLEASRVGPPALAHNQSVYGALTRLLGEPPSTFWWLAVAGPLVLAVLVVAVVWWRRGDALLGICLTAIAMLLASPVSWSHHWVWALPAALVLWERSRIAAVAWTAVFVARPFLWPPWGEGREYAWNPIEHVLGNAYLLAALGLTCWAVFWAVFWAARPATGTMSRWTRSWTGSPG